MQSPASGFLASLACALALQTNVAAASSPEAAPFCRSELIFAPEHWHVHGSCVVELPNRELLACWFHGSGERTADDVKIQGARLRRGARAWSERFVMADTPGYPDCNPAMVVTPDRRLWLFWPTILANRWETALMKYRVSSDYRHPGSPRWAREDILHLTPPPSFESNTLAHLSAIAPLVETATPDPDERQKLLQELEAIRARAKDKLSRRLGWMTRAHPVVLDGQRLLVPLYSDGFDFSLMAYTDDWGGHWTCSNPLLGVGNIQPSIVRRRDGTLYTLMRDNGPAPHRLMQSESHDRGATWSAVTDSAIPNPGSGAEVIRLANGHWLLVANDTEQERNQLAVMLSEDEGVSWPWKRYLEQDPPGQRAGRYHYPSAIQAKDGTLHVVYSHHVAITDPELARARGPEAKSIKHAHFNEEWVRQSTTR